MSTLVIIPARGGSKGVPRKNIRPIAGHPLLAWTIAAAKKSSLPRPVVSTEDAQIASIARLYGAEVLERPNALAEDNTTTRDVLVHAVSTRPIEITEVILLQATSPIRRPGLIDRVVEAFRADDWDSMATGSLQLQYPPHGVEHRRQDIKSVFINDGSVIALKSQNLRNNTLFGRRAGTLLTSREENVDIDEAFDFWLAEKVLEKALAEGWMSPPEEGP
ncbi:MAG: acylneuraminate cytidylyltransferase family protein [Deltaproteobacteria bacterium]|jgi:N-acylneuraminate cytidylyltransferase|nr:acylneuraminate cytidylyltransferase family protein [Deltaproteobacteria bacterium]